MTLWLVRFDKKASKEYEKLSNKDQVRLKGFIDDRLLKLDNPRKLGKSLSGSFKGLWRYRVGSLRLIVQIKDGELVILVVKIGQRGKVYK